MTYLMKTRQEIKAQAKGALMANPGPCIAVALLTTLVSSVVSALTWGAFALLVVPVLIVGEYGFFAAVYRGENRAVRDWFATLFDNYLRKLGGYLWMGLWIFLWTLLFWIPGIVKAYAYSMAPYILADCPEVSAQDALRLSIRMTDGYKLDIFVAGLSFLGWLFASAFTCGILYLLYVGPYMQLTFGGIYEELKRNALENGVIAPEEFEGAPVSYQ